MKELKPSVNIGDTVQIDTCVQTSYGIHMCHIFPNYNYIVEDIEATISLKTGKTKYHYLLAISNHPQATKGWVGDNINFTIIKDKIA